MNSNLKSPKIVKRKFPGPAGLLPEVKNLTSGATSWEIDCDGAEKMFCSQNSVATFADKTWTEMEEEFKDGRFLFEKYNVSWIIDKAKAESLRGDKAPFLAAKIKKIECRGRNPSFILHDRTGEIEAVISEDLYEDLSEFLMINSVIILKNFSVLSMSHTKKRYIVVTANNLVKIYCFVNDLVVNKDAECNFKQQEIKEIQVVTLQDFSLRELVENIKNSNGTSKTENIQSCKGSESDLKFNFDDSLELPPPKKIKTTVQFASKAKNAGKNIFEVKNKENIDSSVLVLSQSDRDIEDVRDALNDINTTKFFDDF